MSQPARHDAFLRYATAFCVYLLLVILFGAWVRITHSGAGCGSHWPTCNGDIVPLAPSVETLIEYTHRLTSGLLGILGLVLLTWAGLRFRRHRVTTMAIVTLIFIVFEALIGAGLVLKELVADDDSVARALVIGLHLFNTLILTGSAALTAWWSWDTRPGSAKALGKGGLIIGMGLVAIVLTCVTGAITALGDTLFPVDPNAAGDLVERLSDDLSPGKHFLVQLRIFHPVVAVCAAFAVWWIAGWVREQRLDVITTRLATGLRHATVTQVIIGVLNVMLAAPGWMQLIHLLMAQAVWIIGVLTLVSARAGAAAKTSSSKA